MHSHFSCLKIRVMHSLTSIPTSGWRENSSMYIVLLLCVVIDSWEHIKKLMVHALVTTSEQLTFLIFSLVLQSLAFTFRFAYIWLRRYVICNAQTFLYFLTKYCNNNNNNIEWVVYEINWNGSLLARFTTGGFPMKSFLKG